MMKRTPWALFCLRLCGISHCTAVLKACYVLAFVTTVIVISASAAEMMFVVVLVLLC